MQVGDTVRARFMTLPDPFPGSGKLEKQFPIRTAAVVYIHPSRRFVVLSCKGIRETFFPEDILT